MMLEARSFHGIPAGPPVPLDGERVSMCICRDYEKDRLTYSLSEKQSGETIRVSCCPEVAAISVQAFKARNC